MINLKAEDKNKKWFEFMHDAQTAIFQGQIIDTDKPNIQIAIEPTFESSILLQFEIKEESVNWYGTSWLRLLDAPKFYDPIENLKYVGMEIKPTINHERGTITRKSIQHTYGYLCLRKSLLGVL